MLWCLTDCSVLRIHYGRCCVPLAHSTLASSIYLTVTLHFTVFFPDFTVMTAVPFFFAVTCPLALTAAIFELLDLYVTFSVLVTGVSTGTKAAFSFFFNFSVFAIPVIFWVLIAPFWTEILTVFFAPFFVVIVSAVLPFMLPAVIVQVPFAFPFTFAIFLSRISQETMESPSAHSFCIHCMSVTVSLLK